MKTDRQQSIDIATSLLAVANTPLFVPTELRQKDVVGRFANNLSASSITKAINKKIRTEPLTLKDEATVYLYLVCLSLKSDLENVSKFADMDPVGYPWFRAVADYLSKSLSSNQTATYIGKGKAFNSNILLNSTVPTVTSISS